MNSLESLTNKNGETITIGDVLFMQSPQSKHFPKAFPESSWMFIVTSLNNRRIQGLSVNWKRKGKGTYVSRELDELGEKRISLDNQERGLRHATEDEIKYFFKRAPEYKSYFKGDKQI